MGRLSGFRYRDIVKILKVSGLSFIDKRLAVTKYGGIRSQIAYTTIPNHTGEMPEGTLRAILKQADVEPNNFLAKK